MHLRVCAPAALLALVVLTLVLPGGLGCPRSCNCYQANEVHCTFRSLLTIPPGLPSHTRRINLGFNSISRIHDSSLAGLERAELLMLHSNDLHHLPEAAFKDMKSLQILKLSYNKLSEISSPLTFSGLTSLLRLYLDHNLLQHIHPRALLQLPSLKLLRLQGNRLHQLHPHALCTLSLLNTYYFSTLRHLDLSNNSLTTLPTDTLTTAPLLETLGLQANPWSCDCRMNWFVSWSLAHPGLMKCPGGPQCPTCVSPNSFQGTGLLDQSDLLCTSPVIAFPGRNTPLETELSEIQSRETFKEPLGSASVGLSDQQGNSVELSCSVTHSSNSQDISPTPDLSLSSSSPIPLALSLSLECPVERESYEQLWRILAYYSETAVRLEREIMLSKTPTLAYRYRQTAETDGYYHTGVKASVKVRPQWLLQPAISIQLNRAQSNAHKVHLIYSTRVSAHPGPTSSPSTSSPAPHPWVLISTNQTITAIAAISGSKVELSCPILSSGNPKVQWILPDGSTLTSPSSSLDGRLQASASGLGLQNVQLSDAGLYYCVAQAGMDGDALPVRLVVEESSVPPSGEQVGPPVTKAVGESISLSCNASGSPAPHLSWVLPDGTIIRSGLFVSGGVIAQPNGSLSLSKLSLRDAGHYRCIAVNYYGSDSLSMQLEVKPQHPSLLRTPFPRGPQSAAGRSTKIRAPLLRQMEEGSGDEEEEEETFKKHPRPNQPHQNRRYQFGKPRRRGPVKEGTLRRGGPVSSTDQRRNRFDNRHRVTTNKQRLDPQKWADLLAKIRQKTTQMNNSQTVTVEPTAAPLGRVKDGITARDDGVVVTESVEVAGEETEGSSVDDTVLQEEGLQPVHPALTEMQTHTETPVNTEKKRMRESSTETQTHIQTPSPTPETETVTISEEQKEPVTSKTSSGHNDILPAPTVRDYRGVNPNPTRTRAQSPRQRLLPNLVPNSRPQSPWNSRRRFGQHRRLINRPRVQPLTPTQALPDLSQQRSQTPTPETATDQSNILLLASTTTYPSTLSTRNDHMRTTANGVAINPLPPPVSDTLGISTSHSLTPSAPPFTSFSPTHTNPHIDMMSQLADISDTAESTLLNTATPAATHSDVGISQTHVPDTQAGTLTHGAQTHTKTHTAFGKHVDIPSSKHSEEQERNLSSEPYVSHSTTVSSTQSSALSSTVSSAATPTTARTTTLPITLKSEENLSDHLTTTFPIMSTTTTIIVPTSSITRSSTSVTSTTSSHTSTTTTTAVKSSTPTTIDIYSTGPSTTTTTTATSTKPSFQAVPTTPYHSTTTSTATSTPTTRSTTMTTSAKTSTPTSRSTTMTTSAKTSIPTTRSTTMTTSAKTSPTTTQAPATIASTTTTSTTTITPTGTRASFKERPSVDQVDTRERPVSGAPKQSQSPPDWKNPAANSIPDSHSSRPHWSPSLPAVPGVPVVRSRPRIADPHIRTVSFPAESTARLACEAQGEPKPSVTWTKVATGAVMSIHSKAQRFEVLPNGTLLIHNVQLQDRGKYICRAHSFLGHDRLLTTLEVWTRPPRMQLASYREATIHQGGDVHLECQADGVPTPLLSWVLPDRSVLTSANPSASRISIDTNGTLHISATVPSDRGVYRCVASNAAGAASTSVRVHMSSLPPVIQQPREEHLYLSPGRPVYAHCSARGAPPPALRWRIPDGTLVRPSQFLHGNLFVLPNGTLHIRGVGPKDAGSYECTASNAVGVDKRTVRVQVEEGAEGRKSVTGARKEDTQAIAIEKPLPTHSLNKDRTLFVPRNPTNVFNSPKLSPPLHIDRSRTLQITPSSSRSPAHPQPPESTAAPPKINKTVTTSHTHLNNKTKLSSPSQPSTVPVQNTNILQSIANNTRVSFSPPSDKSRTSPNLQSLPVSPFSNARIVSTSPSITNVRYGGILQLHCSVTGNPPPIIIWRIPNRKLVDMNFSYDQRLKVHPNGTLSAQAVTEKDAGDYLCIARNKVADDYRTLHVTVATKPAKIEPKHPLNQMVSLGKALKVDCQASGLPDPAVHWSLPDGTMVNSVLQGEDRSGRARRLTVFVNGTLLVPAVGMREEGEYTCYAENQGGQDMMKVKVKVMMPSQPTLTDDSSYQIIKVHLGTTAKIRCQASGDPASTVTWFSPAGRVIPRSLGSRYYSERVVVVSDGTLEVRLAQKIDTGNYTCRASSLAGARSMTVGLEVEAFNPVTNGQVGGRSTNTVPSSSRSGVNIDNARIIQYGTTNRALSRLGSNNGYSATNGNKSSTEPYTGINKAASDSNPAPRSNSQNGYNQPVRGITTQFGSSPYGVGGTRARNVGVTTNNIGINRYKPNIGSVTNSNGNSHSTVGGDGVQKNPGSIYNEVIAGRTTADDNTSRDNGRISGISRNVGVSSSVTNSGAGTGTLRGNWLGRSSNIDVSNADSRNIGAIAARNTGAKYSTNTVVGVVTTVKQRAVKGQNVLLPCPSQGTPPPRLAWLLPGNGVLPAPYYGSRLTVHRNGSLELRGVRATDAGTLVCVVRGERGETRIQVELEVSEPQEEVRSPHRGSPMERPVQKTASLFESPKSGASLVSAHSLSSVLPEKLHPRIPVTQLPLQKSPSSPAAPHPLGIPPRSTDPVPEQVVSTRTVSLVSIINGETLRLPCPQTPGYSEGSLSWTMPSGRVLSRGESADSGQYLVQEEDGTLMVQKASVFDRGTYTCRSTSYDSSTDSLITVPVIVIAYPPRITAGPAPVTYTRPGVAVELPCQTIATPRATVTWETPDLTQLRVMGHARIYGNRYLSPQGSLVIQNPTSRDTGFYRCTAKNVIGVDTKATYLHVI